MVAVAFKDLCIDVTAGEGRPAAVAAFWGAALDQPVVAHDDGDFHLTAPDGLPSSRLVWINAVPEAPTAKSRVHLDIRAAGGDPAPLLAAGGRLVRERGGDIDWHVLEDPDGIALCVFGPDPEAPDELGPFELVVDSVDPVPIAYWWADLTGGTVHQEDGKSWVWIEGAHGFPWRHWVFQTVPEAKTTKNRVHWDVTLDEAAIDDLVGAGATLLRPKDSAITWSVLADPDGNEFCAFH
jgi:hypothetical protein